MVFINLALSVSVVFLMRYVQNLLNSDVKINLVEIVTQNKDAITSRLMMNVNSLDITANKLSDRLKAEESSGKLKTQDLIEQYAKENNTDDLFTANRDGMALFDGGRKLGSGLVIFKGTKTGYAEGMEVSHAYPVLSFRKPVGAYQTVLSPFSRCSPCG